jgi:hypothetical protein
VDKANTPDMRNNDIGDKDEIVNGMNMKDGRIEQIKMAYICSC